MSLPKNWISIIINYSSEQQNFVFLFNALSTAQFIQCGMTGQLSNDEMKRTWQKHHSLVRSTVATTMTNSHSEYSTHHSAGLYSCASYTLAPCSTGGKSPQLFSLQQNAASSCLLLHQLL
jgi:thiamine transporter ThiT